MISTPPRVAVTGPARRLRFGWWATRLMLCLHRLRACYVTTARPHLSQPITGIIIGGGDDIEPRHYGMDGDAGARYDPERDRLEMVMVQKALDAGIPILGICRGAQLINVVLGGNLYSDIRPLRRITPNRNSLFPVKWVDIEPNSRFRQIIKADTIKVNSLHNQAVDRIAVPLTVVARDRDGFIQAFEGRQAQFLTGVQWHPEYLPLSIAQHRLFNEFAKAVRHNTACLRP